ncbi:MAG: hypothetical protein IH991_24980, partial [Planctomycetes bacterium]|nr:hypothetical protein [Planctomycetota bacterium]
MTAVIALGVNDDKDDVDAGMRLDFDMDIDSDNTSPFAGPDFSDVEEDLEDDPLHSGKLIAANSNDTDGDGIVDYLDGFNLNGIPDDDDWSTAEFVPLVIKVPDSVDLNAASISIVYAASDPDLDAANNYTLPENKYFRIWTEPGMVARNRNSIDPIDPNEQPGNYVPLGIYSPSVLGITDLYRTTTL